MGTDAVNQQEISHALKVWGTYLEQKDSLEARIRKFDTDHDGSLQKKELHNLLVELNEGQKVSDHEVNWVLKKADINKSGSLNAMELMVAISCWYAHVEGRDGPICCCTLL